MNTLYEAKLPFKACFGDADAPANRRNSLSPQSCSLGTADWHSFHGVIHGNMGCTF
ncbi:hypothetical protein N9X46_08280 [Paracoccaceae bacterium]|nr:hypothetical protein [Paracoccaceae bacterium]MDB3920520.1 hypothetical protein [Paracoccaceae bacterium]MED7678622.1 hypothetical protein [Rhodobacteraceae bacterium IMCC15231]